MSTYLEAQTCAQSAKCIHTRVHTYTHTYTQDTTTGAYTHLSYNCTYSEDLFVNIDDKLFGVDNVSCIGGMMYISPATTEGFKELEHAISHSHTGLLHGGPEWGCANVEGGTRPGPLYR